MNRKYILSLTAIIIGGTGSTYAASTAYWLKNATSGNEFQDSLGVDLDSGTPSTQNGNGTAFQLGYFSLSTSAFTGEWMPIAGIGSTNAALTLNIGDFDAQDGNISIPDGLYSTTINFEDGAGTALGLPAADTQLAIRFYDSADPNTGNFNTVTRPGWTFVAKTDQGSTTTFDMDGAAAGTLSWESTTDGIVGGEFKTVLAVPEPSSITLLGLGGLALIFRRRK